MKLGYLMALQLSVGLLSTGTIAQTVTTTPTTPAAPALNVPAPAPGAAAIPEVTAPGRTASTMPGGVRGANSFTESQARSRLEKAGYSQISHLTEDPNGVWRGSAMKEAKPVEVGVDYKGDIAAR